MTFFWVIRIMETKKNFNLKTSCFILITFFFLTFFLPLLLNVSYLLLILTPKFFQTMNPTNVQDQTAAAVIQKELEKSEFDYNSECNQFIFFRGREIELLWRVVNKKNEAVKLHDDGPSAFKPVVPKEKPGGLDTKCY